MTAAVQSMNFGVSAIFGQETEAQESEQPLTNPSSPKPEAINEAPDEWESLKASRDTDVSTRQEILLRTLDTPVWVTIDPNAKAHFPLRDDFFVHIKDPSNPVLLETGTVIVVKPDGTEGLGGGTVKVNVDLLVPGRTEDEAPQIIPFSDCPVGFDTGTQFFRIDTASLKTRNAA